MTTRYCVMESPIGRLLLAGDESELRQVRFLDGPDPEDPEPDWIQDDAPFARAVLQLQEFFAGRRREFELPLSPRGTPFQEKVWAQLRQIPYGETITYGELARRVGDPRASRAVGLANGRNPLPVVIPCHRVIGANGQLTGFGGGLPIKEKLLALERGQASLV